MSQRLCCELVSQQTVYDLVDRVGERLRESGFRPDLVVAISRGGFTPARVLCDVLGLFNLTSIRVVHYSKAAVHEQPAFVKYPLCIDVDGQRVLLVDDVNDTGDTLAVARAHVEGLGAAEVRLAVLHEKTSSPLRADYVGETLDQWRWLIYPWAIVEDVGGFLRQLHPMPTDPEEAGRQLQALYDLQVPAPQLERLLSLLAKEAR